MEKRLYIFDLDGTLINTIDDLGAACNYALQQHAYPTHRAEAYPAMVGNGINKLLERALKASIKRMAACGEEKEGTELPAAWTVEAIAEEVLRLRQDFVPYYDTHNTVHTKPYEGIVELIKQLKEEGCTLAVASNKYQEAAEELVEHYFPKMFDIVLGERKNVARKPDPQIVKDILTATGGADKILYIGDSVVDIETAKNAGLRVAACTWGFVNKEVLVDAKPDFVVDRAQEIGEIEL